MLLMDEYSKWPCKARLRKLKKASTIEVFGLEDFGTLGGDLALK
jgi:hypothetical protein